MDVVLCLRETTHFQSRELERPEALCGLESGTRSRLWSTRGDCACRPSQQLQRNAVEICSNQSPQLITGGCADHSEESFLCEILRPLGVVQSAREEAVQWPVITRKQLLEGCA